MAFCTQCGMSQAEQARFCAACGASVNAPVAAPPPPFPMPAQPPHPAAGPEASVAAFVGPNYPTYQRKWASLQDNPGGPTWHWPAFLLGVGWMGYRKMYLPSLIVIGALVALTFLEYLFDASPMFSNAMNIGIAVGFGFSGNVVYRWHVREKMAEIAATTPPGQLPSELARRGGTSVPAGIGMILALLVVLVVEVIVLETIFYG